MKQYMTVEEAASRLHMKEEGIRRFIKRRELKAALVGRKYLITEHNLDIFVRAQHTVTSN